MVLDLVVIIIDAGVSTLGLPKYVWTSTTNTLVSFATLRGGDLFKLVGESSSATPVASDLEPIGTEGTALLGMVCHQTCRYGASEDPRSVGIHDALDRADDVDHV